MGSCKHRNTRIRAGKVGEGCNYFLGLWKPDLVERVFDDQRVGQVIDVFAGCREVSELVKIFAIDFGELVADEVFNCLDVVLGS